MGVPTLGQPQGMVVHYITWLFKEARAMCSPQEGVSELATVSISTRDSDWSVKMLEAGKIMV